MQAALHANSSVGKTEKAANMEAAKTIFDGGDRNGAPYVQKPIEEFASFDSGALSSNSAASGTEKRGFWGRTTKK